MEIVDSMPINNGAVHDWDAIAKHLRAGETLKFDEGTDYPEGKGQNFRSGFYLRLGQRGLRIRSTNLNGSVYVTAKLDPTD